MYAYQFQLRQRGKDNKLFNTESSTPRCDCISLFVMTTCHDVKPNPFVRDRLCVILVALIMSDQRGCQINELA